MRIGDIFRRDIDRRIEEVVKVDDVRSVAGELDEYVATGHIVEEMDKVLEAYQETINSPHDGCTVWVSGFFGSGKSSWAKVLGYLVEDPQLDGIGAAARFFNRVDAPKVRALLNTIHAGAPTTTVLLNLATGSNVVAREGESILVPVYRALLRRFGYSDNIDLAELEIDLERDHLLGTFETTFAEIHARQWKERRFTGLARNEASQVLHVLQPTTYSSPDSWARSAQKVAITADWLAERALLLLDRRGGGDRRVLFVIDEVGQYVARSVQRMLDLQGLAEAVQMRGGSLWLVVTSQERLTDIVDSLESRRVELARAQARFPLRVDLLPSDIEEVTSKRVLDKSDAGRGEVQAALEGHWNQLVANTRLDSPTRSSPPAREEVIRLYPMLPYQVQLLIDAVSARRAQGGGSPTVGGSSRTMIRHAQALITNGAVGLANAEVGALVTLDRSYDLLTELVPTAWRAEVDQVSTTYGAQSVEAKALKIIALCSDVPALPLGEQNIAALMTSEISSESMRPAVASALRSLRADDRIRETEHGYRLQSPEQKDWEHTRRGIDLSPGTATRLRRQLIRTGLPGLTVARSRTFRVHLEVEGEVVAPGDVQLLIEQADVARRDDLRIASRDRSAQDRLVWTYETSTGTFAALVELHRSEEMVRRRDSPTKTSSDVELLGGERERAERATRVARTRLAADLLGGHLIFRGDVLEVSGTDLRLAAQNLVTEHIEDIYPELDEFNASLTRDAPLTVLRTTDLSTLPEGLRAETMGLLQQTSTGLEFRTDSGPLARLVAEATARVRYGNEATGAHLEKHFAAPPFGASAEVVQALCAAAIRSGLLEVIHQGQVLRAPNDSRLDTVLTTLPRFRASAFRPREDDVAVSLAVRTELAQWLETRDLVVPGHGVDVLAGVVRAALLPLRSTVEEVAAKLSGLGLNVPDGITRLRDVLRELASASDTEVVRATHATRSDLASDAVLLTKYAALLADRTEDLRAAISEAQRSRMSARASANALRHELEELLRGDLLGQIARIAALTAELGAARLAATKDAAARLDETCGMLERQLRQTYAELEPAVVAEALRPLVALAPPPDLGVADAATLEARIDSAHARAGEAAGQLDQVRAQGQLVLVPIASVAPDIILDEDGLEGVLVHLREVVANQLSDGKQVRLT